MRLPCFFCGCVLLIACGVKGPPLPPPDRSEVEALRSSNSAVTSDNKEASGESKVGDEQEKKKNPATGN